MIKKVREGDVDSIKNWEKIICRTVKIRPGDCNNTFRFGSIYSKIMNPLPKPKKDKDKKGKKGKYKRGKRYWC